MRHAFEITTCEYEHHLCPQGRTASSLAVQNNAAYPESCAALALGAMLSLSTQPSDCFLTSAATSACGMVGVVGVVGVEPRPNISPGHIVLPLLPDRGSESAARQCL